MKIYTNCRVSRDPKTVNGLFPADILLVISPPHRLAIDTINSDVYLNARTTCIFHDCSTVHGKGLTYGIIRIPCFEIVPFTSEVETLKLVNS